jgi:hypothetical protein
MLSYSSKSHSNRRVKRLTCENVVHSLTQVSCWELATRTLKTLQDQQQGMSLKFVGSMT